MRFKTTFIKNAIQTKPITCVGCNNVEDVYYCGDDHLLMKWSSYPNETVKVCDLPEDLYPTDLHWFPKVQSGGRKQASDLLLLTSADGKFHLVHKNGRFEKSVEAHKGAALVGQWSYDGAGILTAGEDGQSKIWSRSGMLRSTIIQGNVPIYTATWGADSKQVLLAQGRTLVIKHLAPNTKPTRWKAHDGLILKVAWNQSNSLIVSGGEDCKYKVWDSCGRLIYSSAASEYPITSLSWAPGGEVFAVGAYNTLRLCDKIGWSHSLEKPNSGNIYALSWSVDGSQLAGACSNGNVILAHIVDRLLYRRVEWKNFEVVLTSRKSITVHDVLNGVVDKLDLPERVAKMNLEYNHLVVTTPNQCHIFSTSNWNTPFIFDLKEGPASVIVSCYRHFLLVEKSNINIYSYEGKILCSLRIPGIQAEVIDSSGISLSTDTLAVSDQNDEKVIHLFDISASRQAVTLSPVHHTLGVMKIALNQAQSSLERQLAFIDRNHDIYVCGIYGNESRKISKLGVMIQSLAWNPDVNILAGMQYSTLIVWLLPSALQMDKQLLRKSSIIREMSEFGRSLTLISFNNNQINMRRLDGAIVSCSIPPYCEILHGFANSHKWEDALRLCRFINDELLWACCACIACHSKELRVAEEAFAAINEFEMLSYVQFLQQFPLLSTQNAYMALLCGNQKEAENILLLNGLIFRAIFIHLDLYNWDRALELAVKHRTHVDTVLYKRKCYLESLDKEETNDKFLQYEKDVNIDVEKITEKIQMEFLKEQEKSVSVCVSGFQMAKDSRPAEQVDSQTAAKKRRVTKANVAVEPTPQPKTPEIDLYNEVVSYEEKEAKERNAEDDAKLYLTICGEIKTLLMEIAELKEKGSENSAESIKEKQVQTSLKILMLKKLNRLEKVRMKESRLALQTAREQVDSDHLHLQNMLYEVLHLTKEVKKCLEFKSKDEEMDLIPVEEFYANAPESISNPEVTKKNDHELKLARLQWELIQRKELAAHCKKLEASKEAVGKEIEAKKEQLNNLAPSLKAILDATKPLQENLGVSIEKSRKLFDLVFLLPKALYVLYVQADAFSQVVKWISVSINGECDKSEAEESHLDDISSDDSDSDEVTLSHRRKLNFQDRTKPGAAKTPDKVEQKKNECMKKHPLSVVVKVTLKSGDVLSLEFQWLILLEIICVLPLIFVNDVYGIAAEDLLSPRNILSSLYPGDTGEDYPNSSTYYQLCRAGLDSFPSATSNLGIPYRWAQEICGIDLLPPVPEIRVNICQKSLETTLKAIKTRFRDRLLLSSQVLRLETGYITTHRKILTSLKSFITITFEDFSKLSSARTLIKDNIIDGSFIFYKATLLLGSAKIFAYVAVSPNYPKQYPIILLEFSYKGTRNALTSNGLRDIEREVNVYSNDSPEKESDEFVLLRQIKKLLHCVEIFFHIQYPNDINLQPTYFKDIQGRSRSHPYKYISSGGGIYIHR